MKPAIKAIWAPVGFAITLNFTCIGNAFPVDVPVLLYAILLTTVHFYLTHGIASRYYGIYNPGKAHYWRAVSLAYIPFILSFWAGYLPGEQLADNFDFSYLAWPLLGLLAGFIVFSVVIVRKVKMDFDLVLALAFMILVVGGLSATLMMYFFGL